MRTHLIGRWLAVIVALGALAALPTSSVAQTPSAQDVGVVAEIGFELLPDENGWVRSWMYVKLENAQTGNDLTLCDFSASQGTKAYVLTGNNGNNPDSRSEFSALLSLLSTALVGGLEIRLFTTASTLSGVPRCELREVSFEQ